MNASILMVDDRPGNLVALRAILEPLDCNLVEARSGVEALKYLLGQEFALILMDVQMPEMDGFETTTIIKERERTRHIPIIFVTAISKDQQYVFKGYSSGAVDYISKPFDPDILRSKVAVFIDLWNKTQQIKEQAARLRQSEQREKEQQLAALQHDLERRHMAELAKSEAHLSRFKSTLDATLDGVLIFDADTLRYSYVNQGAMNLLGFTCDEMLKMTAQSLQPELDEARFRKMIKPLIEGHLPSLTFQTQHHCQDGSRVPVEVLLQFIAPGGEDGRFVSIVRDISDRKRAEEALMLAKESAEQARELAERANRAKSDFIAGISHELRTPLNAILGFSKLLLNPRVGPLNEDQRSYTQDVVQSAEHLLQLINDILDLSKIEAGKMKLEYGTFSLAGLLEQSLTIVRESARAHRLTLSIEVTPEVAALTGVAGDGRKIKQVMYNLLSNAVKFTPDGGSVIVRAEYRSKTSRPEAIISVSDTGIGISAENQKRIFQAFEQVDTSYTRHQQGTGLGLSLAQRIVELHGGRLWLESVEGEGSTFFFALPLRTVELNDTEFNSAPSPATSRKKKSSSPTSTQSTTHKEAVST
ncbi:MAG: hypothetical protein JWN98_1856 [Abditibacteriota bacterium]|nr:hypothetical protein [Abditibacteriota bacterium]